MNDNMAGNYPEGRLSNIRQVVMHGRVCADITKPGYFFSGKDIKLLHLVTDVSVTRCSTTPSH